MAGGDEARLENLRAGRNLYINKCSGCHSLIPVDRFDDAKWAAEVDEMVQSNKVRLTPEDRSRILAYLTAANDRPQK